MKKNCLNKSSWSAYTVGAGIGILSWVTVLFMGHSLGASPTFVRIAGILSHLFSPTYVRQSKCFSKYLVTQPAINWMFAFVVLIFFGAMVSSFLGNSRVKKDIPSVWSKNFGNSKPLRYFWAFIGGMFVIFGARLAGGCTSGHGITGGMRLALSGWIFVIAALGSAIISALLIYKKR